LKKIFRPSTELQKISKISLLSRWKDIRFWSFSLYLLPFFWKRLISFFLLCKNHLKNACCLWGLADFYISEKNLTGVFKKNGKLAQAPKFPKILWAL
jgi:hypothetical protein